MSKKNKRVLFLFLGIFCFGQGFANVHSFHPPSLSVDGNSIDLLSNATLQISCSGKYPLSWKIPSSMSSTINDSRISIISSVNILETVNKHKSRLTLEELDHLDTGFYTCIFENMTDLTSPDNATSIYVFVNDPTHLFVENAAIISGHLLIPLQQHRRAVIPCLPTSSSTNVTLWKMESEDDFGEIVTLGSDVAFDPRFGFMVYYPTMYFNGFFQCRAVSKKVYQSINLTLFYMADTYNAPQPYINTSQAQHPVVNGTFILTCIVDVDIDTRTFIDWDYPNKNNTENRIKKGQPMSQWKTTRDYKHQEVSIQLIVERAQPTDSGTYICTVTDHSQKTGNAAVNIYVFDSQQPIHVNLTTDIDTSQPIIGEAGDDVKFIITVHAFPSVSEVELHWEKNGRPLLQDTHYHMNQSNSSAVLEIKQLTRYDAATYTLHGRTKDMNNSISILLEVKDAPVVSVKRSEIVYAVGREYHLECHADGYPPPIVWWRWKPCTGTGECTAGGTQGWKDVEPNGHFPNMENVTLEYSYESSFSLVSNMHLVANQSGHYKCIASNVMGKDDAITPFVVTDAEEGFEIYATNRKPVDKDVVQLICKVNVYNFSSVEWKWRPMNSMGKLMSLVNVSDTVIQQISSPYSHSSVVTFNPIHLNMSGEYECIAESKKNNQTIEKHLIIDVREIRKPVLNSTNLLGNVVAASPGSLQEFYCYTDGVPYPLVTWKKDGVILDVSNMSGVEIVENNQRLTIRRVLKRDAGRYECLMENRGGYLKTNATLKVLLSERELRQQGKLTKGEITAAVVIGVVAVMLVIVVTCLIQRIKKDRKQKKELNFISHNFFERGYIDIFNPSLPLEDQIDLLPYKHNYEFPKERLKLGKTLGQGAFGRVVKAEAIGLVDGEASTTVAVKMLKEAADMEQRKALIAELKILIHIGKHLNIVNLLGAVTKNFMKGELYVIVEYCCYGNMRHHLLKHKGSYVDQLDHRTGNLDPQISTLPGSPFSNMKDNMTNYCNILGIGVDNPSYRDQSLNYADLEHPQGMADSGTGVSVFTSPTGSSMSERYLRCSVLQASSSTAESSDEDVNRNMVITTCDLLCYAFQCARGMEYLASKKLIHRDLAARNVLLAKDNVVKICDFGLAKDCYKYANYVKKTNGLLPIKWMAIESIRERVFTTKSDIWSFGVLLWELFTLGSNPYPSIEINEEFFKRLKNGYRMEKPELAPEEIYQLMSSCWLDDPNQRPDFSYLAESIGSLLENGVRKYYIELNTPYQMMNEELFSNNNDYLRMTGVTGEDYTNMVNVFGTKQPAYDNLGPLCPNGHISSPKASLEVVPMIQLDSPCSSQDGNRLSSDTSCDDEDIFNNTAVTYLNMASSYERDETDDHDSGFVDKRSPDVVHYENGECCLPLLIDHVQLRGNEVHVFV